MVDILSWPAWLLVLLGVLVASVALILISPYTALLFEKPFRKKEWWQDRYKRIEKEIEANKRKRKKG